MTGSGKLVFVAGGIGVTPFRSMTKYLLDNNESRSIITLYSARNTQDFAYKAIFEAARQKLGMKTVYYLTDSRAGQPDRYSRSGYITAEAIQTEVPDYQERMFYISGTYAMVTAMQAILKELGVSNSQVKVDFFSGYA